MTVRTDSSSQSLRRAVYVILGCVAAGMILGRILAVDAVDLRAIQDARINRMLVEKRRAMERAEKPPEEIVQRMAEEEERIRGAIHYERPFLSANDRSRLAAARALVEPEMRIEGAPFAIDRVIQEPGWDTIDMVQHDGPDGRPHLYSSKPPLYIVFLAGQYWVIHALTGWTLGANPFTVGRILLVVNNLIPLLIYFAAVAAMIERFGRTDWGRIFAFATAAFGTFLTTFAVTINNHVPAAVCAAVLLWALMRIWIDDRRRSSYFVLAGTVGALLVTFELPALALFGLISLLVLWVAPWRALLVYLPAAVVIGGAFFGTNWMAHQSLKPPYLHRGEEDNWYDYTYEVRGRTVESYWRNPQHLDRGEGSPAWYTFNLLLGHHGIFSLTPVWMLSVAGALIWLVGGRSADPSVQQANQPPPERAAVAPGAQRLLTAMIALVTLVLVAFYLTREGQMRNYGGMTSGLRWMFWLAPAWLLLALPALDRMQRNPWLRGLALLLLAASALSVAYPTWNPWSHPWLMNWFIHMGWA